MEQLPQPVQRLAIIAALPQELQLFLDHSEPVSDHHWSIFTIYQRRFAGREVLFAQCGVGKVLSALLTQLLIERFHPDAIFFTGLAGAIDPGLQRGDIVVAEDLLQHDMDVRGLGFPRGEIPYTGISSISADPHVVSAALTYHAPGHKTVRGRVLTGDQFIAHAEPSALEELRALGGHAVEMEGASVALACNLNAVRFGVFRTISDHADGSAAGNFQDFLQEASHNSYGLIQHLLASTLFRDEVIASVASAFYSEKT